MLFFGRKKRPFGESAKLLADGGFTEEYIEKLRQNDLVSAAGLLLLILI